MFYKLKPGYILRGWKGISWVLVKRPDNQTQILSQENFHALLLCDGETQLPDSLEDKTVQNILKKYEEEGVIEPCEQPCPLEKEQYYRYHNNRYIIKAFWSITGRCNFRCRHCYMDAPDGKLGELSTKEAFDLIDQLAECGVLWVDITGGEPFVRKDFWQLIDRILSYHINIRTIFTNGWLFDEHTADMFECRGLKPTINFSFDGIGWHDWMRGIPGAENAALHAMRICQKRGFPTTVGMCIHRGNIDTIPQTVKTLRDVGVSYIKTANVDETELWKKHSDGNELTWKEYTDAVIPYIDWYYKEGRPVEHLQFGGVADLWKDKPGKVAVPYYDGMEECVNCYMCSSVRWSCYITPEGRLLPCMPMTASPQQEKFPLVQDIGLKQGLSDSYYMQFVNGRIKDLFAENAECNACQYRYKCGGGCRAAALASDGKLMGCDRGMCMFWKNGYYERIKKAIDEAEAKYGAAQNTL